MEGALIQSSISRYILKRLIIEPSPVGGLRLTIARISRKQRESGVEDTFYGPDPDAKPADPEDRADPRLPARRGPRETLHPCCPSARFYPVNLAVPWEQISREKLIHLCIRSREREFREFLSRARGGIEELRTRISDFIYTRKWTRKKGKSRGESYDECMICVNLKEFGPQVKFL